MCVWPGCQSNAVMKSHSGCASSVALWFLEVTEGNSTSLLVKSSQECCFTAAWWINFIEGPSSVQASRMLLQNSGSFSLCWNQWVRLKDLAGWERFILTSWKWILLHSPSSEASWSVHMFPCICSGWESERALMNCSPNWYLLNLHFPRSWEVFTSSLSALDLGIKWNC